ncbi:hypothetical protein F4604DRAFT_1925386 [Suillus subluteus]|nr:hypothetical protein F4604DRAFT_1925386 [Suillus subluteus]
MHAHQAEFLCSKIPMFRRYQPWDSRTDLLIDEIFDKFDERWPLCEEVLPGFDLERDTPNVTHSQLLQLRDAYDKFRIEIKCFLLWETRWVLRRELRESGVEPRDYWTYWGVGRASDWAYWGVRR